MLKRQNWIGKEDDDEGGGTPPFGDDDDDGAGLVGRLSGWLMVKMRKTWARPQLVVAELAHIYISTRARVGAGGVIDVDECVATAVEERFEEEEASEERRREKKM